MNTRTGKIARLPKNIREQLNRRLENGEKGKILTQWLNGLPEVQKLITTQFAGHPIREQNLSEWKKGGYIDWLRHQEIRAQVRAASEQADDLGRDEGEVDLSELIAYMVTTELMTHMHALHKIRNAEERWHKFRQIARELSRVRRDDQRFRRNLLRREQWETQVEPLEQEQAPDSSFVDERTTSVRPDRVPDFSAETSPPSQIKTSIVTTTQPDTRPSSDSGTGVSSVSPHSHGRDAHATTESPLPKSQTPQLPTQPSTNPANSDQIPPEKISKTPTLDPRP